MSANNSEGPQTIRPGVIKRGRGKVCENFQVTSSGTDNASRKLVTAHRSDDSHMQMTSFVRKRAEGEAGDDDSDQSFRGFGGEVATSSGVMSAGDCWPRNRASRVS